MGYRKNTVEWARYKNAKRMSRKGKHYIPSMQYGNFRNRIIVKAPKKFSLIDNRDQVIHYINEIFTTAHSGLFIRMDMSEIEYTDPLTVTLVMALMMDARMESQKKLRYIEVKIPSKNVDAGRTFEECHFKDTVVTGYANQNYFMSRTSLQVNQSYTGEIIEFAKSKGISDATSILNPLLVEIFSNTNNHATLSTEDIKLPWFLSIVERNDRLCFSVIDLGIGIYESLRSNDAIQNIPKQEFNVLVDMYSNDQSRYLSQTIPKGVYSSTRLNFRGKGLKTVYQKANSSTTCTKFDIISNKAMIDILNINRVHHDSDESFSGTAFYWEMKK